MPDVHNQIRINAKSSQLALLNGTPRIKPGEIDEGVFRWPIVTTEDEEAVIGVLRDGSMSGTGVTKEFEGLFRNYIGTRYALAHCNGTMSLLVAMHAAGVGEGDEIICPSITYWASAMPALSLGAGVQFADVEPDTLCIDPKDIPSRITDRTKAIVVVHYCGHPAKMDQIMEIAGRHNLKVIEDVSHAHGSLYRGRMCGTFGDVSAMSMMALKSFPIGEGGMLVTDNRSIYERAISFAHYERHTDLTDPTLQVFAGIPIGGIKGRLNQTASAMGITQLRRYPERINEIQRAMNYFWDLLDGVPGLRAHRTASDSGSTMGGWYNPLAHYLPEELGGLPVDRYIKAVQAEGGLIGRGANSPLHLHPVFVHRDGPHQAVRSRAERAVDTPVFGPANLPVSQSVGERTLGIPWFKKYNTACIEILADSYRKVAEHADQLIN